MVHKAFAVWLLALALSPFTTPFSTCDLRVFFSSRSQDAGAPRSGHMALTIAPSAALPEAALAVPPLTGRIRIASSASATAITCLLSTPDRLAVSVDVPHVLRPHDPSLVRILRV
jgi:hypothetical protein